MGSVPNPNRYGRLLVQSELDWVDPVNTCIVYSHGTRLYEYLHCYCLRRRPALAIPDTLGIHSDTVPPGYLCRDDNCGVCRVGRYRLLRYLVREDEEECMGAICNTRRKHSLGGNVGRQRLVEVDVYARSVE